MLPNPLPSLRQRKKAATKERLYLQALDLFRRQGYGATTIGAIAAAAEVSRGTFFNYFPGKEALLHYLGERLTSSTAQALAAALADPGLPVRARLQRLGQALAAAVEGDRALTRVVVFERLKTPAAGSTDPYRELLRRAVSALLREGQSRGEVAAGLDPELWSSALTGVYLQQIIDWCAAAEPYALGARMESLLDGLWRGVGQEQPA